MASAPTAPTDNSPIAQLPDESFRATVAGVPSAPEDSGSRKKLSLDAKEFFYSLAEWDNLDLNTPDNQVLIGTPLNSIIRPGTKNIIEAPEKTFKTTMLLRLTIGMACGHTVYPSLPVARPVRVVYIHGEMTPKELEERQKSAQIYIPAGALALGRDNFITGRCLTAHLVQAKGQADIRRIVDAYRPDVLVLDPWQSFITGCDENSFKDFSKAMHFLDELLADHRGMTLFLVVHQGKNHERGMRGHSSLSGWRDTLIRLKACDGKSGANLIRVEVRPRWGDSVVFKLRFDLGTMTERLFSPQSANIRDFVESKKGWVQRAEIEQFLGGKSDASKKAIQRAVNEEAIKEGTEKNKGKFSTYFDDDSFSDVPIG